MVDSNQIVSFDILKGGGILLVILGHIQIPYMLKTVIYSFHMPLFFFVSGCFFRPISLREFFAKKTRQLLIPWAFFAFLLFAYLFVLKLNETHNWAKAISLPVTSMFDGFLGDENSFILFHVIWFLICLFEVSFVYLLIHKIIPYNKALTISALCILLYGVGYWLNANNIDLPYFIDTTMSTLIYYHLGFCFMRNKWYGMKVSPIYSLFLLIIAIVFIVLFPSYVDLKSNNFPLHLLLLSIVFIMNFYWFINSYFNSRKLKLIPLDKILIWCGINSLALLGLHILFVDTFWIVRNKLHLVNYSWTILEFALIVAICYFATTLIKRYIPSVLGRS